VIAPVDGDHPRGRRQVATRCLELFDVGDRVARAVDPRDSHRCFREAEIARMRRAHEDETDDACRIGADHLRRNHAAAGMTGDDPLLDGCDVPHCAARPGAHLGRIGAAERPPARQLDNQDRVPAAGDLLRQRRVGCGIHQRAGEEHEARGGDLALGLEGPVPLPALDSGAVVPLERRPRLGRRAVGQQRPSDERHAHSCAERRPHPPDSRPQSSHAITDSLRQRAQLRAMVPKVRYVVVRPSFLWNPRRITRRAARDPARRSPVG
jgi:hypothetical protein